MSREILTIVALASSRLDYPLLASEDTKSAGHFYPAIQYMMHNSRMP